MQKNIFAKIVSFSAALAIVLPASVALAVVSVPSVDGTGISVPTLTVEPTVNAGTIQVSSGSVTLTVPTAGETGTSATISGGKIEITSGGASTTVTGPTATGSGTITVNATAGTCPSNYITSEDNKTCLKIDVPAVSVVPTLVGAGEATVRLENGKCPEMYTLSPDKSECLKVAITIPTITISPTTAAPSVTFTSEKVEVGGAQTITVNPKEGFKVIVDQAVPVAVEKNGDVISISHNNVSVSVQSGESVKVENGKVLVSDQEIKVMPDVAVEAAKPENGEVKSAKLESGDNGINYQIETTRKAKLFGLFEINLPETTSVNAQTSETKVSKPWWSFLIF